MAPVGDIKAVPEFRTPFPSKTAFLQDVGISRSRANLGEQISKIAMKEFEDCAAEGLAQGRAVEFEEMVNAVLRRHQLNPGVRTRPWSNNDEGLFGVEANGEKLSYAGRLYRMTKRLSEAERIIHITRVSRDLPERQWHPLLAWLFTDRQVANLLQDLSQRPIAEHEKQLRNLTKEVREASSVVDYAEVTKQAHERTRATTPARTKKAKRRKSGKSGHASEIQAAHQRHA